MSSEFRGEWQLPDDLGEQFLTYTFVVALLQRELLRKKLGDEFLVKIAGKLALEKLPLDMLQSLPPDDWGELTEKYGQQWDEQVQGKTFELMERGIEPDPRQA